MGWLARLVGKQPPRVPFGGRAFVSLDGKRWSVRVQMPGEEPTSARRRISPKFDLQTTAYAFLETVEGKGDFHYPEGDA
ncbi:MULTISPECIES: hypothetical protein [unclassified Sphingomonas]|uniref:hypothetical protein n=1 Tax=unclassified Sphingomonas TaxID=196159 RepID=UPI00226A7754|nr:MULTISPECIES: hypothetical protein [unclassified Sphingomonas]